MEINQNIGKKIHFTPFSDATLGYIDIGFASLDGYQPWYQHGYHGHKLCLFWYQSGNNNETVNKSNSVKHNRLL